MLATCRRRSVCSLALSSLALALVPSSSASSTFVPSQHLGVVARTDVHTADSSRARVRPHVCASAHDRARAQARATARNIARESRTEG
jgi:hypothetical protein